MYFTDRGIEELAERRGRGAAVAWSGWPTGCACSSTRNPQFEDAVERLATFLARDDDLD